MGAADPSFGRLMEFTPAESETLLSILQWRRDVRHFRRDPVDEALLDQLRATMDRAPSVGNARPWRVLRVQSPSLRAEVRANFQRCNDQAAKLYTGDKHAEYLALKLAGLDAAPVQLAVFTEMDPAAGHGLGRQTLPEALRQSTAMAIFTLWLAARAQNLGLGMVSILDPAQIEALFAVPAGWEFSAYLCIGHPEFMDDTPLLHRAGWQENAATDWPIR